MVSPLLKSLRAIKSGERAVDQRIGICMASGDRLGVHNLLVDMNLDPAYPLPGGETAYMRAKQRETLWSRKSPYGRARWALLDQMIAFLEARDGDH